MLPDTPVTPPAAAHTGLATAQRTSHGIGVPKGRLGAQGQGEGRDLRCRRVEVSDSRTVVESEGGLSDQDGAESQLHTHHDVVCKEARGGVQDQSGVSTLKGRGARLGEQPSKHKAKGVRVYPSPTLPPLASEPYGRDGASRPPSLTHRLLWAAMGHHSVPGKSTSRLSPSAGPHSGVPQSGRNTIPQASGMASQAPSERPVKRMGKAWATNYKWHSGTPREVWPSQIPAGLC